MTIFHCSECEKPVSDTAKPKRCPHCFAPAKVAFPGTSLAEERRNWNTKTTSISIANDTLKWLGDASFKESARQAGLTGRSAVVQLALDRFFHACVKEEDDGSYTMVPEALNHTYGEK